MLEWIRFGLVAACFVSGLVVLFISIFGTYRLRYSLNRMHAASIRSNEAVARVFGYHPVYLNDLIKQATGKTLHSLITDAKLQLACQYLSETEETIESIAMLAGFCSRTHFCTLFKKTLGLSPTQYRKRNL